MHKNGPSRFDYGGSIDQVIGRRQRGFTLVELLLSLMIMAMILLGMQSAVMLASRAAPDAKTAPAIQAEAGRALQMLAEDVCYATAVTRATASELILTVPDRDGDGNPDTIRYYWNGVAGSGLTRQFNSSSAQTISAAVQSLAFSYDTQTQTTAATTSTDGPEILLGSFDTSSGPKDATVDNNHWIAACFRPNIPASASSWSVTRVKFQACMKGNTLGTAYVQVRPVTGGLPGSDILAQATFTEPSNTTYAWQEVSLTGATGLTPGTAAALVIQWASDNDAGMIAYRDQDTVSGANLATTTNGGSSWGVASGEMLFYAYGKVRTPDPAITQTKLRSLRCTIRLNGSMALDTACRARNEPVIAP